MSSCALFLTTFYTGSWKNALSFALQSLKDMNNNNKNSDGVKMSPGFLLRDRAALRMGTREHSPTKSVPNRSPPSMARQVSMKFRKKRQEGEWEYTYYGVLLWLLGGI